jgi:hypothetical protein
MGALLVGHPVLLVPEVSDFLHTMSRCCWWGSADVFLRKPTDAALCVEALNTALFLKALLRLYM